MKSVALIGAAGRVARLVRGAWLHERPAGGFPLYLARRHAPGIDTVWDTLNAPAPDPGRAVTSVIDLTGVTPRAGGDLTLNSSLALASLGAARRWGARQLFVCSSSAVYGATGPIPRPETGATSPSAAYGQAKLAVERALTAHNPPPRITILRLGNVAGAGQPFDAVAEGGTASIALHRFGDGTGPSRSYIGPRQLARILHRLTELADEGVTLPPVLNIATPRPTAMADLLETLGRPWHRVAAPPEAIQHVHLDTSLLQGLCPHSLDSGTARALIADIPTPDPVP